MKKIILGFLLAVTFQSCTKNLQLATQKKDTKWVLEQWVGKTLPAKQRATLNIIGGNKINGKSFCNTYGGSAVINGNAVKFSQVFSTKMFCNEVGDTENKFLYALEHVDAGTIDGGKLKLMKNGELVFVFKKNLEEVNGK